MLAAPLLSRWAEYNLVYLFRGVKLHLLGKASRDLLPRPQASVEHQYIINT